MQFKIEMVTLPFMSGPQGLHCSCPEVSGIDFQSEKRIFRRGTTLSGSLAIDKLPYGHGWTFKTVKMGLEIGFENLADN